VAGEFLRKRGVTCFSELNDNLLMWAHCGGRYEGICLEFAAEAEPFRNIRQVQYVEVLPTIDLASLLVDRDFKQVMDLFCTKSTSWAYEKEWRAMHTVAGTEYVYPAEALTGVFFGPDVDSRSLEIVCLILQGQNDKVRLWQGTRSTTEFRVLFKGFTYTSFLEAKRRGLA